MCQPAQRGQKYADSMKASSKWRRRAMSNQACRSASVYVGYRTFPVQLSDEEAVLTPGRYPALMIVTRITTPNGSVGGLLQPSGPQLRASYLRRVVAQRFVNPLEGSRHLVLRQPFTTPSSKVVIADVVRDLHQCVQTIAEIVIGQPDDA